MVLLLEEFNCALLVRERKVFFCSRIMFNQIVGYAVSILYALVDWLLVVSQREKPQVVPAFLLVVFLGDDFGRISSHFH